MLFTVPWWPTSTRISRQVDASHIRAVVSLLPVSTCLASGEKATAFTESVSAGKDADFLACFCIPQSGGMIITARDYVLSVRRQGCTGQAPQLGVLGEGADRITGRGIPQARGLVETGGEHIMAVRAEKATLLTKS